MMMPEKEFELDVSTNCSGDDRMAGLDMRLDIPSADALFRWLADGMKGELRVNRCGLIYIDPAEQEMEKLMDDPDRIPADRGQHRIDDPYAPWGPWGVHWRKGYTFSDVRCDPTYTSVSESTGPQERDGQDGC